jgi:LPXTG-motif cell wall-anchored protein
MALAHVLSIGAGVGVGQDAYPVENIGVSPTGSLCIGGTATFSGGGATPGSTVSVAMLKSPGEFPSALLGTAVADSSGNWSLTVMIPVTGLNGQGNTTPIVAGTYTVGGIDSVSPTYLASTTINLLDCSALPKTGEDSVLPKILGGVLLVAAGAGLVAWRRRSVTG